jgi:integrase
MAVRRELIIPNPKLKLLEQNREVLRLKHYAIRTERCYCDWIKRHIHFHRMKLGDDLFAGPEVKIEEFLGEDMYTVLAEGVIPGLREHFENVRLRHQADLRPGYGSVYLPGALDRKHPGAAWEWGWQYVFPERDLSVDPRTGVTRRRHVDKGTIHHAIKLAVSRVGVTKQVSSHTFRHSFVDTDNFDPPGGASNHCWAS